MTAPHSDPAARRGAALAFWAQAGRARTLPAAAAPVLIGIAMALTDGSAHAGAALAALLGAALIQLGTNFANDYFDFVKGTDLRDANKRGRALQSGRVSARTMGRAAVLAFGLAALIGLYLVARGGWPLLAIGVASILAGVLYTGGPFPYGYRGLGDVFVLVFFGPVAVAGTYYVQALTLDWRVMVAGLGPGLLSVGILAVNNLRDADTDALAGKRTLAVLLGKPFARREYVAVVVAGACSPLLLVAGGAAGPWAALPVLTVLAGLPLMRVVLHSRDGAALDAALAGTGRLLLVYTALFCAGWWIAG